MRIRENTTFYAALVISTIILCAIAYKIAEQHGIQLGLDSVEKMKLKEPGAVVSLYKSVQAKRDPSGSRFFGRFF